MLLKNGTLVNGEKKDILIIDGKIAEIADYIDLERAKKLSLEKDSKFNWLLTANAKSGIPNPY